ncbi:hypothetical protein [Methylobacterium sp.]|uniref:hypothetical protein n=1 Tax=Methylobacterium sp. TaxID=409 RepID=UPI0025FABF13|nr:hypothetical protein [Methylobacterium sp.]MBY0260289.1 hypothetical protein [Methylobacterium sp.]
MTLVLRSTYVETVSRVRVPVRERSPRDGMVPGLVTDVYRYRSIGSLQALGLAAVASVVTTLLLLLVLGTPA